MLTIMVHATIKKERLDEYIELMKTLAMTTDKEGCLQYTFLQNKEDPTNIVLFEQWKTQEDWDKHIKELFEILGPASPGNPIPDKVWDMYESATPVVYEMVDQYGGPE